MSTPSGRIAVVTGAASGNGRAIALRLARDGAEVAAADIDETGLAQTVRLLEQYRNKPLALRCDVSRKDDIDAMFAAIDDRFGRVDIVVANAGVAERDTHCLTMTESAWDRTIDTNLKGVFFTLQAGAKRMVAAQIQGRLIAISSILGEWGSAGAPAYCASKGGVRQLVRSFGIAVGPHGITCNAVGPGFIRTAMTAPIFESAALEQHLVDRTPAGYVGDADDVAAAVAFLSREDARYVNGTVLYADGGMTSGLYSNQVREAMMAAARKA